MPITSTTPTLPASPTPRPAMPPPPASLVRPAAPQDNGTPMTQPWSATPATPAVPGVSPATPATPNNPVAAANNPAPTTGGPGPTPTAPAPTTGGYDGSGINPGGMYTRPDTLPSGYQRPTNDTPGLPRDGAFQPSGALMQRLQAARADRMARMAALRQQYAQQMALSPGAKAIIDARMQTGRTDAAPTAPTGTTAARPSIYPTR